MGKIKDDVRVGKELSDKLSKVKQLSEIIVLHRGQVLDPYARQAVDNEQYKLEFELTKLLEEFQLKEADLKIVAMNKIVELLK